MNGRRRRTAAIGAIGFYDGIFGPGTGSFLMIMFVRLWWLARKVRAQQQADVIEGDYTRDEPPAPRLESSPDDRTPR